MNPDGSSRARSLSVLGAMLGMAGTSPPLGLLARPTFTKPRKIHHKGYGQDAVNRARRAAKTKARNRQRRKQSA